MLEWKYKLTLNRESTGAKAEITHPISVSFDITRTTQVTPNQANFTITNLEESTRKAFEKMRPMDYAENKDGKTTNYGMDDYCSVIFTAQREGGMECVLFKGDVIECGSELNGSEWATTLDCSDGYYAMKFASLKGHYEKDAFAKANFEREAKKWKLGAELNADPAKNAVPITINESFSKTLEWAFPNNWFIDNSTLIAGTDKNAKVYKIDGSWILKTPKREENILRVSTLLFPEPRLGTIAEIESVERGNMGQWEVAGIAHKGEFPAGDMESEFTLIPPGARYE